MFLFPFLFFLFFFTSPCIAVFLFPKSGDFESEDMTVSFRVWLPGRYDFCSFLFNWFLL